MKQNIIWARTVWELFEDLPESEREAILDHFEYLVLFPHMYPVRTKGRFAAIAGFKPEIALSITVS